MSNVKNEADHLPKEKKEPPFGKCAPLALTSLNSFALKFKRQPLAKGSNSKVYPQMLSSGQNPSLRSGQATATMLNRIVAVQECDATKADSSTTAWTIKIFLN